MKETEFGISDDDVVRYVREGNVRRYEILVDRYKNKIVNFIHKMIFDYDEAQSLAQDVFLKVYESITKYKSQDNFQAFIFTIAKNMTLNYIKKQKRMVFFSGFLQGSGESKYFQEEATQHAVLEEDVRQQIMTAALKELNENQRIALVLKVYLDFSYNKIAEITGWSIPKIETLISRAKSNLKKKVLSMEDNSPPDTGSNRLKKKTRKHVQENAGKNVLRVREI